MPRSTITTLSLASSHPSGMSKSSTKQSLPPPRIHDTNGSLQVLTQELTALLDNKILVDLRLIITTTQLHTTSFHGHSALLLNHGNLDAFLDKPLSPSDSPDSPVNVHTNHSRLPDLLATLRSLYTDPSVALPHLSHLLSSSALSDCTLVVEDPLGTSRLTSARAHKCILAARCPYFATLFQSAFADAYLATYSLPSDIFTSPQVFDNVLAFVYTAQLHSQPTSPLHVFDLFQCANYLGMASLESHLEHVLRSMVHGLQSCTCTACCSALPAVLLFADRMSLDELRAPAIRLFASAPLLLWTSLDFVSFPARLQSAILLAFVERAEHDPQALLRGIVTLDTLVDRLAARAANNPASAKLVDTLTSTRDNSLIPQLVPNLPHLCTPGGPLDKPPLMDVPRRLDALASHLIPKRMDPGNAIFLAFTLCTTHAAREQRAAAAADGLELNSQVTEALGELARLALEWVAKRWINLRVAPPRGVYPASPAWQAFLDMLAAKVGVPVDDLVLSAAGAGSVVNGGSQGGGMASDKPRQPRVRSMVVVDGADARSRPAIKGTTSAPPPSAAGTGATRAGKRANGSAVAGSRVEAGRTPPPAPRPSRPASVVGGLVGAASATSARRALTTAESPRPRLRAGGGAPMNAAARAERAKSMIVSSSSTTVSGSVRESSLRPTSSLASSSSTTDGARGRPAGASLSTVRKVARSPSVVSTASSSSVPANTAAPRRAPSSSSTSTLTSTRRAPSVSPSKPGAPPASVIRRSASMATLPSTSSSSSSPSSPLKPSTCTSSSPLTRTSALASPHGRSRRSSTSSSRSTTPADIPPVPPLPAASSHPLLTSAPAGVASQRKYDPARLERLRRKSAESAARTALGGSGPSVAAVDLMTFVPSRIPAPTAAAPGPSATR